MTLSAHITFQKWQDRMMANLTVELLDAGVTVADMNEARAMRFAILDTIEAREPRPVLELGEDQVVGARDFRVVGGTDVEVQG